MDLGLKNKRVVITGASRGLGEEIAKQFFKEGALLTLIARNEEKLKSLIKSFGGEKKGHNFFGKDLRIKGEPTKVAKEIIKNNKKIDVVVHNLGGSLGNTEIFTEIDNWLERSDTESILSARPSSICLATVSPTPSISINSLTARLCL